MMDKTFKELKEMNKTLSSIRTFTIAEAQLLKTLCVESQRQGRDIKKIKLLMEEKHGSKYWWKITWGRIKRRFK